MNNKRFTGASAHGILVLSLSIVSLGGLAGNCASAQVKAAPPTTVLAPPVSVPPTKKPPLHPLPCNPCVFKAPPNTGAPSSTVAPLYRLALFENTMTKTADYNTLVQADTVASIGVLEVERPSISLGFGIWGYDVSDVTQEDMEDNPRTGVGYLVWTGLVRAEACLTSQEAAAWPGASDLGETCASQVALPSDNAVPTEWYKVAEADQTNLQLSQNVQQTASLNFNTPQIITPMRFHIEGKSPDLPAIGITMDTDPFDLIVLPEALIQLKVIPFTILYMPPGNQSKGTLTLANTYSTTQTDSITTEIDTTTKQDDWTQRELEVKGTALLVGGAFQATFDAKSSTKWDQMVGLDTAQQGSHEISTFNSYATSFAQSVGSTTNVTTPGASGPYADEPFWNDQVVVLVHPQFAFWNFNGTTKMQLLGGAGPFASARPMIAVSELDQCANATGAYPNGYKVYFEGGFDTLTADECRGLASLDPFWGNGQAASLAGRGHLLVSATPYGRPAPGTAIQDPRSLDIQEKWSSWTQTTDTTSANFKATVQDILSTSQSAGITIGAGSKTDPINLSDSITLSKGSSLTQGTTMGITYKDSTATKNQNDTSVEGSIVDNSLNLGYDPLVEIYQDEVFGTAMFRDPTAQNAAGTAATAPKKTTTMTKKNLAPTSKPPASSH